MLLKGILCFAGIAAWIVWRFWCQQQAQCAGVRWGRMHPAASLYAAITQAQTRWPLRDDGQDPCLYAFLKGFHEARSEAHERNLSDSTLLEKGEQ